MRKNHRNTHVHRNDTTYPYIRVYQQHTRMYFNVQPIEQNSGKRERIHEKSQENDKFLITHEYREECEPTCKCRIDNELLHHCLRNLCGDAWKWENSRQQPEQTKENQPRTEEKKKERKRWKVNMKCFQECFAQKSTSKIEYKKGKRDPVTLHLNNDWYSLCTSYDFFLFFFSAILFLCLSRLQALVLISMNIRNNNSNKRHNSSTSVISICMNSRWFDVFCAQTDEVSKQIDSWLNKGAGCLCKFARCSMPLLSSLVSVGDSTTLSLNSKW